MEFIPMRTLSREPQAVLSRLQQDGEIIVTKDGQPIILMIDLASRDLVDVVSAFRQSQGRPVLAPALNTQRKAAAQNFLTTVKSLHQGGLTAEEQTALDELDSGKYKLKLARRLDL